MIFCVWSSNSTVSGLCSLTEQSLIHLWDSAVIIFRLWQMVHPVTFLQLSARAILKAYSSQGYKGLNVLMEHWRFVVLQPHVKIIWMPPRPPVYTQTFVIIKQKLIYFSKVIKRENWTHWLLYSGNLPAFSFVQLIGPALERDSPEVSQLTMDIRANTKTWGQMNWDRTVSGHMVSGAQRWAPHPLRTL